MKELSPFETVDKLPDTGAYAVVQAASHDMRGILGVISGLHSLLPLVTDPAQQSEMFERLHNNTEQAAQLFADLEDYCAMEAGKAAMESVTFAPGKLLDILKKRLTPMLKRRQVDLHVHGDRELEVSSDEDKVLRIVRNIIFHLIHHLKAKNIDLNWGRDARGWQIQISYSGAPLPEWFFLPEREEIGDTDKPIGLLLVHRLLSLLAGSIAEVTESSKKSQIIAIRFGK